MKVSSLFTVVTTLAISLTLLSCTSPQSNDVAKPADSEQELVDAAGEPATVDLEPSQVPQTVLVDDSGLTVTATGLDTSAPEAPKIDLSIANDTDKPKAVQAEAVSVNGYMVDAWLPAEVGAHETITSSIELSASSLARANISTIQTIELSLIVFDGESWEQQDTFGPFTLTTSAEAESADAPDESGDPIFEAEGVTVHVRGITDEHTPFGTGQSVVLEVTNNSDETVTVSARDTKLNGEPVNADFSALVAAGKHSLALMSFARDDDTGEIKTVETTFSIFASDGWEERATSDPISFEP